MSVTGEAGGPPLKPGVPIADINAGLLAAMGVMAAYTHKLKTGEGQVVDTSLMEAAIQQVYWQSAIYFATGRSPGALGSAHVLTAPYQAFHATDGYINIGGANQSNWERICDVLGHPEWKTDPRYLTNDDRMQNLPALVEAMNAVVITKPRAEWQKAFDDAGVPAGPVNSIGEALTQPQVLARDMVVEVEHPKMGRIKSLGCPIKFSKTPSEVAGPPPLLGEHTREILKTVGYNDNDIDAMLQAGTVAEPKEMANA
jgi:crotonobetainyl-CoA:carnitine CoA-transferase CaiB-like acyl-CoA transferase